MDIQSALTISAKGMRAQGARIKVISENMANAETTPNKKGADPYRRQLISFRNVLDRDIGAKVVDIGPIQYDNSDFRLKYMPGHPAADENGMVKLPNVNSLSEMTDLRESQRSYEANLGVMEMSKSLVLRTIDLLRA